MSDATSSALEAVRDRLRRFADEAAEVSPFYSHLAAHAAADDDVAGLLTDATAPDPALLLAAVQRVLQAEPFHELTNYYPALGGSYGPDPSLWPLFRTFVLDRADKVRALVARRVPRGNEVGRAALFYPAVAYAARLAGGGPVGLLEVEACAGLLLGMDLYSYRYQSEQAGQIVAGPGRAALGLHCALRLAPGQQKGPAIPKRLVVAARVGLDTDPVDLDDEDEYAWLEACVWPDQPDRLRQLGAAVTARRKKPPTLVQGDPVAGLADAAGRIPRELPVIVLTSNALRSLSAERVTAFRAAVAELAAARPAYWVSLEAYAAGLCPDRPELDTGQAVLAVTRWAGGEEQTTVLAQTSWHGERMHWLA